MNLGRKCQAPSGSACSFSARRLAISAAADDDGGMCLDVGHTLLCHKNPVFRTELLTSWGTGVMHMSTRLTHARMVMTTRKLNHATPNTGALTLGDNREVYYSNPRRQVSQSRQGIGKVAYYHAYTTYASKHQMVG